MRQKNARSRGVSTDGNRFGLRLTMLTSNDSSSEKIYLRFPQPANAIDSRLN